ncbi:MAG: TatD family hydrolase [Betaproteobacteria bacterium]|jgi:TatD DNase family protein
MYVDSHCHLNFPELRDQLPEVKAAMQGARVTAALVIATTIEEFGAVRALAESEPAWHCTVGVHPDTENLTEPDEALLLQLARHPKVVGIGETGLDYYRLGQRTVADMEWQRQRFRTHIRAAKRCQKPLVVHTRSASEDTLNILREEGAQACGGVFHCFTETEAVARAALELGFYISFSGILTFKNAQDLRAVASWVPMDRMLIETDSPFLAPVPYRGRVNQPAYVAEVARQVAELRGLDAEQVGEQTTENFKRLFKIGA